MAEIIEEKGKEFYRWARNVASGATDAEIKVKDATNNDKWGPTGQQMKEISDLSHSPENFNIVMNTIWKRLNDNGKYWRHVYKALLLLDYMLKNGSEQVVRACLANVHQIRTLRQFQFVSDLGKDEGQNVRQRAKLMVELLGDKDRLREERKKARENAAKFNQAISSDGWGNTGQDSFGGGGGGGGSRGRRDDDEDWDDRRGRDRDRASPRRDRDRSRSRSPSPGYSNRRRSPSPVNNRRDNRRDSRSPSPEARGNNSGSSGARPRAPSGGRGGSSKAAPPEQAPPQQAPRVVQQQPSATSLLFDFPTSPPPAAAPVGYNGSLPGGAFGAPYQPSSGQFTSTAPVNNSQLFASSQPLPPSSANLFSDFNPRAPGGGGGQGGSFQQQQPVAFQPSFQPAFQPAMQPAPQEDWAKFNAFQGANSAPARPADVVSTNQHLYNLEQLSAPAAARGPGQEKKKTLAELAAEQNAQHPKPAVLTSAPRPVMGPTTMMGPVAGGAPPMQMGYAMTPQQQYDYQQQLLLQQQMARMQMGGTVPVGYGAAPPPQNAFPANWNH